MGWMADMAGDYTEAEIGNKFLQLVHELQTEYAGNDDVQTALRRVEQLATTLAGVGKFWDELCGIRKT